MAHPLAANLLLGYLDLAPVAGDTAIAYSLVLSAIALVVLRRSENHLAEQTFPFRLVCPVVDGFRLEDLAARTRGDVLRRRESNAYSLEIALDFCFLIVESRHISI